jgi:hypothetical protein
MRNKVTSSVGVLHFTNRFLISVNSGSEILGVVLTEHRRVHRLL